MAGKEKERKGDGTTVALKRSQPFDYLYLSEWEVNGGGWKGGVSIFHLFPPTVIPNHIFYRFINEVKNRRGKKGGEGEKKRPFLLPQGSSIHRDWRRGREEKKEESGTFPP